MFYLTFYFPHLSSKETMNKEVYFASFVSALVPSVTTINSKHTVVVPWESDEEKCFDFSLHLVQILEMQQYHSLRKDS